MKRKLIKAACALVAMSLLIKILCSECSAAESKSWYIKRNGGATPGFPSDADELDSYDCYYLDKTAAKNGEKVIYLTFDAGYENGNIEKILDTLRDESVTGAFFILDNLIYKNVNLLRRMESEGHTVANHTASHKNLCNCTYDEIRDEVEALSRLYEERVGAEMSKFFRFPEGKYSLDAVKCISELGYKTVFWSFGYEDWDNGKQPDRDDL